MVSVPLSAARGHRRAQRLPPAPGPWPSASCALLGFFGEHAASAIRTAQLIERQTRQVGALARLVRGLREQTHEHANHLHAIRGLLALGAPEDALRFVETSRPPTTSPTDRSPARSSTRSSPGCCWPSGVRAAARDRAQVDDASRLETPARRLTDADAVTIIGNLLENAFDAVAELEPDAPARAAARSSSDGGAPIRVADRGRGLREQRAASAASRPRRATPASG
jgi:sensor histidine kinase regulating citrate/malate metabolism